MELGWTQLVSAAPTVINNSSSSHYVNSNSHDIISLFYGQRRKDTNLSKYTDYS